MFRNHSLHADRSVSHLCAIMSVRVRVASAATLVLPFSAAAGRRAGGHSRTSFPRVGTQLRQPQPQQQYRYRSSSSSDVVTISDQEATQKFTELNQKSVLYFTATWYVSYIYIYIYTSCVALCCRSVSRHFVSVPHLIVNKSLSFSLIHAIITSYEYIYIYMGKNSTQLPFYYNCILIILPTYYKVSTVQGH